MPYLPIGIEIQVVIARLLIEKAKKRALIAVMKLLKTEVLK